MKAFEFLYEFILNRSVPPICATVYDGPNQSGTSVDLLIGDFDAADTESPLGPLKDKTESVSVNPVESSKNHACFMSRLNSEDVSKFFCVLEYFIFDIFT